MPKCLSCGYLLEAGEPTCPVCGASAAQTLNGKGGEEQPAPPPKARPPQSRMIIAGAFAVVAIGLAILMSVRALGPRRPSYLGATRGASSQGARVVTPPAGPEQPTPEGALPPEAQMPAAMYPQTPPPPPPPPPSVEQPGTGEETPAQPESAEPEATQQVDPNTTTVPGWVAYPKGGTAPTVVTAPGPEETPPAGAAAPPPAAIAPTPAAPTPPANQGGEAPPESGGE